MLRFLGLWTIVPGRVYRVHPPLVRLPRQNVNMLVLLPSKQKGTYRR